MLISIVLTTRNSSSYINNALEALAHQTNKNFELIIIDDASDDLHILKKIITNYSTYLNITAVFNKNKTNASRTRNQGINLSNGELTCFHDADDIWYKDKVDVINRSYTEIANKQRPILLFHDVQRVHLSSIQKNKESHIQNYAPKEFNINIIDFLLNNNGLIQTSSITINRHAQRLLTFDSALPRHQDVQFCIDAFCKKASFLYINATLSYWVIIDKENNAYKKGASTTFCFDWLTKNKALLSNKNIYNYYGKVIYPIAIKEKSLLKTINRSMYKLNIIIFMMSIYIFSSLILKKIMSLFKV